MSLLAPGWLFLGALTVLVLALHMRRRRQIDVPSVMLWRLLENSAARNRSVRRPPSSLVLVLQLLVVALTALALAQPLFGADRAEARHTIYVLDASGSMRATDQLPSRFGAALSRLDAMIEAGTSDGIGNRVSVVTVGAQPRIQVARQTTWSGILPLVTGLKAGDGSADWNGAKALVAALIRAGEPTGIVVLTDGADAGVSEFAAAFPGITKRSLVAGADTNNIGLTAAIAPINSETGEWRVNGTVRFSGPDPDGVTVEVLFQPAGTNGFIPWMTTRVVRLAGAATAPLTVTLKVPGPGALQVQLPRDAGPADNDVYFVVNRDAVRARVLYLGTPGGPLLAALQALDYVDVVAADQLPPDDRDLDLVVVDRVTVLRRPATNVLWLGEARVLGQPVPPALGAPYVTGWDTTHALSDQVDWTAVDPQRGYRVSRLAGATVLAESSGVPLVQARTTTAGREVQLAFSLADSGWVDRAGFPVFISNLVRWLGVDLGAVSGSACVVGTPCLVESRFLAGRMVAPDGTAISPAGEGAEFLLPGAERAFVAEHAGLYSLQTRNGTRTLAMNTSAETETALAPLDSGPEDADDVARSRMWWWLLAATLAVLLLETWISGRGNERFLRPTALASGRALSGRRRLQLGLRAAGVLLLVGSLAGLPLLAREIAEKVVVIVSPDLGVENPNAGRDRLLRDVEARLAEGGGAGHAGLVAVGGAPQVAVDIGGAVGQLRAEAFRGLSAGANLEAATLLGAAMLPADRAGRLVIATDGNETVGQIARAVAAIQARNVAVDIEPLTELPPGEVLVESVNAPPRVYLGDTFLLDAVIYAQAPVKGTVTIWRSGESVFVQEVDLLAGRNRVETAVPAAEAGNLLLEVSVVAPRDTFAENNKNGVIIHVAATPSIAIVTPDTAAGEYFARALAVQGLTAAVVSPRNAPKKMDGWLAYDSVVLMNMPAISIDTDQQEMLEKFVQVHGRGLLILGGENSFGPGGYFGTPFERMSPLSSRVPHEAPKVAIIFVLDRSGSMTAAADETARATRLDVAKEATLTAIALLPDEARIGVVVFDHEPNVLIALQRQKNEDAIAAALAPLVAGGGTFIFPGLALAMEMLRGVTDVSARHIVVMTDGLSQEANFAALFAEAQRTGITISAIAISSAADPRQPLAIAEGGKGAFYHTDDMRALPSILSQETLMLSSSPVKQIVAPVSWVNRDAGFLAGLPQTLPSVHAYVRTTAQPRAQVHLAVTDDKGDTEPLMASWRYGNGHVLALATHGAGLGTEAWVRLPEYPLMWAQAIRHFLPDAKGPGLHVTLRRAGDSVRVATDVVDKDGAPIKGRAVTAATPDGTTVALLEVGPGRYEGAVALPAPGAWRVDIAAGDLMGDATMYVAYPARYDFARSDFDKLRALAGATGGRLLVGGEPIFRDETRWVLHSGWRLWTLLALALFLADLTVRYAPNLFAIRKQKVALGSAFAAAHRGA